MEHAPSPTKALIDLEDTNPVSKFGAENLSPWPGHDFQKNGKRDAPPEE